MQNLLFQILQSPQDSIINSLELRLDSIEGINEFLSLLNDNNPIAFTYMKMKIKDWIEIPKRRDLLSHKEIFYKLIESSTPQNFELFCDSLEIMSYKGSIWEDFIEYLTERSLSLNVSDSNGGCLNNNPPNPNNSPNINNPLNINNPHNTNNPHNLNTRYLRCLNFIFKKFRFLKKSNDLYTEIINSILKTSSLFTKFYFESPSPLNDLNLLEIFYSLVYQDIHPFFEDNSPKFFSSFIFLYKQENLQDCISEIYNLFISKYPECIDMTQILGSVLTSINGFDFRKYQILLNITRRKNIHAISKFKDIFIHAIQFGAKISIKEQEEIINNSLEYTRSILKNQDNYRGMISEIINHCRIMFGDEWVSKLLNSGLDKEMVIYFYLCLKIKEENVIEECIKIINEEGKGDNNTQGGSIQGGNQGSSIQGDAQPSLNNNPFLFIISLRYLISINHFIGINCLSLNHPGRYFAFFYLRKFLDLQFGVRDFFLNSIGLKEIPSLGVDPFVLLPITLNFIISNREDEYSSNLLLSIFKYRYCYNNFRNDQQGGSYTLGTPSPLNIPSLCPLPQFFDYIRDNILNINSISSYNSLFDVLGFIYLEDKNDSFILELVDIILREDLVDLYSSTFYLLSLVVLFSKKDLSGLIQIITIEKLWSTKELRSSLVCLTTSLYKKGYCTKEQLDYILGYLPKHYSYILLVNTLSNFNLPKEDDLEEDFILKTKFDLGDLNLYRSYYNNIINYFLNNFITKKNLRRVLRGLSTGSKILNTKEGIKEIVDKNSENLDYGNVPLSVMVVFDI